MQKIDDYMQKIYDNPNKSLVIFDFDYTLTKKNSNTSIGVFTNYLPKDYQIKKRFLDKLYKILNSKIFTLIIWKKKLKLLAKYYNSSVLKEINYNKEFMLNDSMITLINNLLENKVKVIIYSSGMKEIIVNVLKNNSVNIERIEIVANSIDVDTKRIDKKIITPKNKRLKHLNYKYIALFGDSIHDLKIASNSLKVLINDEKFEIIDKWRNI